MATVPQEIVDLYEEMLARSKELAQKMILLESLIDDALKTFEGKGISLPFHYEETQNAYRLRIKTGAKINGTIYIPKVLSIKPDKLLLVKEEGEQSQKRAPEQPQEGRSRGKA